MRQAIVCGTFLHIPVQWDQKPRLMINKTTASVLQVTLPEALLKTAILVE